MAPLLYCVTLLTPGPEPPLTGVAEQPVAHHDSHGLRVYWSEVSNPETLAEGPSRKAAEGKYRHVLREALAWTTPIAFPFPALVAEPEEIDALLAEKGGEYTEALQRLAGTVQYELTATWDDDDSADFATPVSGREYLKRREESQARIAAIDTKLKTVTGKLVREWQSQQDRRKHRWYALVRRADREHFLGALRSAGPSQGVRLRLSGPWPPGEFMAPSTRA